VRLRFSRTADYSLRAALEIARASEGELITRRRIAAVVGAPPSVLAQALAALVRAELLVAHAGPRGGYELARPADEISIYEIVSAIDGEGQLESCVLRQGSCSSENPCAFHPFMAAAQARFLDSLREWTLADVLAGAAAE
jgi:Rrf2 family iron-sulfur cluster assembly transcriptional regulator